MLESRLFVVRCCTQLLLVGAIVTYSGLASALDLGEITVYSALNQPLRADIALVDAAGLQEGELSVSLATADEFSRAGVERGIFLNDLRFTPVLRGNRSLIRVTSRKPVNEPFLNFLVQFNQANGRVLREYTLLIDPPGSPAIVPATDEPLVSQASSEFPDVQPAVATVPERKEPTSVPATPAMDPLAEQMAASVVQNQQLQATIDELKAKLQATDEQFAAEKKQVAELQARLAEVRQATAKPIEPEVTAPAPVIIEKPGTDWLLMCGLLMLVTLLLLAWFIRCRRQPFQAVSEPTGKQEPMLNRSEEPLLPMSLLKPVAAPAEETPARDVLEGGAMPRDEFQLNPDDLSMDANWDLTAPSENPPPAALPSSEWLLAKPGVEWDIEPVLQTEDDIVLDEFAEPGQLSGLEPLHLAPSPNR
ncbi:hypothetical protein C4E44_27330 [Pseudomonas sp. MWU12-2312b]|nr:hypothetical protein C4E44_27330 [Pseudomonas sp. MWU12-2312b]